MFKFLRKYDKWILAIGGSLLLITFLVPQAIQGLSQYSAQTGATWATVGAPPATLTAGEADFFRRQVRLIDSLGPQNMLNRIGAGSDPAHWFLLLREAEAAGLIGGPGSGLIFAQQLATNSGEGITPEQVVVLLGGQAGLSYPQTLETLAQIQGVGRLISLVSSAGRFSDTRLRGTAARKSLGVAADVVVLDARTLESIPVTKADEEALVAQLTSHGESLAGEGDQGFGYRIPDRFKIEWMSIPRSEIVASMDDDPGLGPIELRKAYQRNPERFGGGSISTGSTSGTFATRADKVRELILADLVDARMQAIAKFADDRLQFPRRSLDRRGLHFELPEGWSTRRLALSTLATDIGEEFDIPAPAVQQSSEEWLIAEDLRDADRFGLLSNASTELFGRTRTTTADLIPALKEFGGSDTIPVQAFVSLPSLNTPEGDLVITRITEVDPSHAPTDLEEVRDEVTADLDAILRYETLVQSMPEIIGTARTEGIRAVANTYGAPVEFAADIREANLEFLLQYGITMNSSIPGIGNDAEAIAEVVNRAIFLDPTRPVADQPIEDRVFAIELPERLAVLVVSVETLSPLTQETWARLATNPAPLQTALSRDLAPFDPAEVFGLEALSARHAFELSRVSDSDEDEEFEIEDSTGPVESTG